MAFSGMSLPAPTALQLLLDEIKFQQQKELQFASVQDTAGFMSRGTTYWTDVFVRHFLFQTDRSIDADDLLFFIRKKHVRTTVTMPKFQTDVEVFRKDSKKLPIGDPEIEWKETVFLNLLIHQLEYTLTLAICTRTSPKDLQVLKRHSQKVYASPSRRRMDTKGEFEEITYPYLSFMVDNYDEVYSEITARDGEMVCVELLAADRDGGFQAVLFLGSIRYDALKRVYDSRASLGSKMAQRMTFGFFSSSHSQRVEYVRLKGPYGKGHAEVAVSKPKGAGAETPTSEPGFCMTDGIWDSDVESDSEEFVFKHHRRLSDPSSNLNNYSRSGWKSMKGGEGSTSAKRTRSQNEGLDYCGLAEIEAGDVRDDRRRSDVWCCGCCGYSCECMKTRTHSIDNVTHTSHTSHTTSKDKESKGARDNLETDDVYETEIERGGRRSCCCPTTCPNPFPRSQSLALDSFPMSPVPSAANPYGQGKMCHRPKSGPGPGSGIDAQAHIHTHTSKHMISSSSASTSTSDNKGCKSSSVLSNARRQRHPLIPSKTVVEPPSNYFPFSSLMDKSNSISCLQDAKYICREKLLRTVPNKLTPSGVRVLYFCDPIKTELDDGAYNPLWTMRGFTQTFHMWRESRRAQSVPLNAFLTYITLPCSSIMKDILDRRDEPVLTF